jgi:hypothetical protein
MKIPTVIITATTIALLALGLGCATTQPIDPVAAAVAGIHATVPIAVEYACSQDKNCVPYLVAAAGALDLAIANGTTTPQQLIAALDSTSAKEFRTPLAHAAILSGIGVYEAFLLTTTTGSTGATTIIGALAVSIREGLPPNAPAAKARAKRN